jgi:hypothetical protein
MDIYAAAIAGEQSNKVLLCLVAAGEPNKTPLPAHTPRRGSTLSLILSLLLLFLVLLLPLGGVVTITRFSLARSPRVNADGDGTLSFRSRCSG